MTLGQHLDITTAARVPSLIWGPPGVGKSAAIRHWAASRNLPCWTVIASLREPADFGGLPVVSRAGAGPDIEGVPAVSFAPPRFAVEAARRGGIIFLDELTTAPPAVQAALLRAVLELAFGDLELDPDRVTIVAAANPPAEAAGGWDLAAPLANRFIHHPYAINPTDWVNSFPTYWGASPELGFANLSVDASAWQRARLQVAAFIRSRPSLLLALPKEASRQGQAWPSPRSWDFASRLLARIVALGNAPTESLPLIAGCVGEGPASEFLAWVAAANLPDPEVLLNDPDAYVHNPRGDISWAILTSVAQAVIDRPAPPRWRAAWKILGEAARAGGTDVASPAMQSLVAIRSNKFPLPKDFEAFFPIFEAVGIIQSGTSNGKHPVGVVR
jgi:hypothetical protein